MMFCETVRKHASGECSGKRPSWLLTFDLRFSFTEIILKLIARKDLNNVIRDWYFWSSRNFDSFFRGER